MSFRALKLYAYIILLSIVLMTFIPVAGNDFVNWDDYKFVKNNPFISALNLRTLIWSATSLFQGAWHPLTWLSHALDVRLWGYDPAFHHLMGAILHAINVLLVCSLFVKLQNIAGVDRDSAYMAAFVGALLYGVHPLRVESVAWLSARKDLVCAFFFLLSVMAYLIYAEGPTGERPRKFYYLALFACAMALMSKAVAITLPLVLLILDYYPLMRLNRRTALRKLVEKTPFFALALGAGALNFIAAQEGAVPFSYVPLSVRVMNSFYGLIFYIYRSFLPTEFIPLYQLDRGADYFSFPYLASAVLALGVSSLCIRGACKADRACLAFWASYIVILGPTLGIFMSHRHAVADRYSYLPTALVWLAVGRGVAMLIEYASRYRRAFAVWAVTGLALAGTVVALSSISIRQIGVWKSTKTLWSHIINNARHVPAMAYAGLASDYERKLELEKALELYQRAWELNPKDLVFKGKVADVLALQGNKEQALAIHEKIRTEEPDNPTAHANVGRMLGLMGRWDVAIACAEKALALDSNHRQSLLLMVALLMDMKQTEKAIEYYQKYKDFGYTPQPLLEINLGLRAPLPAKRAPISAQPLQSKTGP